MKLLKYYLLIISFFVLAKVSAQPTVSLQNQRNECLSLDNGSIEVLVTASTPIGPNDALLNVFGPATFTPILGQPLTVGVPFSLTNLPDGAYIVVVQDATGNLVLNFTIIDVLTPIAITADPGNPIDNTDCVVPDGEINVTVSGGSGTTYSYSWTGPGGFTATTEDISGLAGGTYTLVATDNDANCSETAMFTIDDPPLVAFNITTADPQVVCSIDDVTIDLSGSENSVIYEIYVNGTPSGFNTTGDGNPISITIPAGNFADGDVLTVEGSLGLCSPVMMTGSVTINFNDPIIQNITTASPQVVCSIDDITIDLDGSEVGVTYEILVNSTGSGVTAAGTGAALSLTITAGNFGDGDVLTVEGDNGQCQVIMNGSVTVDFNDPIAQNITTVDPQIICSTDDLTINIDGSEVGVTYEILVNGVGSGFTSAGTGAALGVTITAGSFGDGDVLTIEGDNGQCQTIMNGSVTVNIDDPIAQNITTASPQIVCSIDDVTIDLDGSEVGVTYEILVNGGASGFTAAGTGAALSITITAGNFADGDVLTVQGTSGTASCVVPMNGSVTVNLNDPVIFNVTTASPQVVCSDDDITLDLDGSEIGVTYEVLVNGTGSGVTAAGTGAAISLTITAGNFGDGDILTIEGDNGQCQVIMNNSVTVDFNDPVVQNITTVDPQIICTVDDLTLNLDGSEVGVTYEILVNGVGSGFTAAGTGAALGITITAGNFADGDVLTIEGDNGQCQTLMNGSVTINFDDPVVQNITTADPQVVCSIDDVTLDLDGSEVGVTYEIFVNGGASGFTAAGTGAALSITITAGSFGDGDILTIQATSGTASCTVLMNGSVTVNLNDPTIFNVTTANPQVVCSTDDLTINIDGSQVGVTYEVLVNGGASGFTAAGTGAALGVTITAGSFGDGDVLTVEADNGQCQTIMNGSVTISIDDPNIFNITTADPLVICSVDDATLNLDGSEAGVTYEILINGVGSGVTTVGTGAPIGLTLSSGTFTGGDVLTIQATSATASCDVLMNGSVTININDPSVQNITTVSPQVVCSIDDITVNLDGSEIGVTYEILVNGGASGFTTAGNGGAINIVITAGNFADGDVLTVEAGNGQCTILMNGSVTVDINDPIIQNITTVDPLLVCSVDDATIDLDGSEVGVTYEILVNGAASGFTTAGTGAAVSITITAGNFADGDVLTVEADNGQCQTIMNGSVTINFNDPAIQNITTADPLLVCSVDDVTIDLDGSEVGVTYEILVNGTGSGFTTAGTGAAVSITITSGNFADGDVLTVEADNGQCQTLMNGSVTVNFDDPAIQNITTASPLLVCSVDDVTIDLDGSEAGVTYEILVNGAASGATAAGTGAALSITITAGNFADGDVLTVQATSGTASCIVLMNGSVTVNFNDPIIQNITNVSPLLTCSTDDVTITLDGSEVGVTYEILVNGAASGATAAGTGAGIGITITSGSFAAGDVLTVEADNGQCQVLMNGSVTINFDDPVVQNVTTASPQLVCSVDDLAITLDNSEVGVTYEILVNGTPSGFTSAGTGGALAILITAGNFADGDVLTVQGTSGGASCTVLMNGSVTVNFNDPAIQNITTVSPQVVCSIDDVTIDLDGSEAGVTYEILVNGALSGFTGVGTGAGISIAITAGNFGDADILTVQADNGQCQTIMNGSVTIDLNDPTIFNITTPDPLVTCVADDVTINLDGSEVGVTYEILVNGAGSGFTAAGTGAAIGITITAGSFADGDVLTVEADNGQCQSTMNGSVTISFEDPAIQNLTTADPQVVCSIDDITLDLDGSEAGVTYEVLVNGTPSGFTAAGTGAALSVTITAGNFGDGDVLTIQATSGSASCTAIMNGSVTVNINDPAIQNITTASPLLVCSVDDVTIDLDGSEAGVTYEILVNGAGSGFTTAGTGAAISITITAGNFAAGDVLTVEADNGQCQTIMNGSVTVNINDPSIFNITTVDPLVVCSVDDATIVLDGSDAGVTYEILVNGAGSGFTAVGTGGAIGITITAGSFTDGDVLTIEANNGQCTATMNGSVTINFNDPAIFNITTPDPQVVCSVDDVTIDIDGSEVGVTYEILVNGALSGFTTAGTGAGISVTITAGNFTDGDVLTIQADNGQCVSFMNGSVTIDFNDPAIQNITTADPLLVCSVDDVTIDLDGSELATTYEILVNGAASGFTTAGTGAAISITITAGNFADGDVLTVEADNGQCQTIMNGSVTVNFDDPAIQNITTADPQVVCSVDDVTIDLDGSEVGVTYEILVNGAASGFTAAGTGAPLGITITAGNFTDGDVLTVQGTSTAASCVVAMNGSVTINFNDPAIQNITTADPLIVCSVDDVTIDLDGSEVGVTYEILVNGAGSGFTTAGTGAAIGITITAGNFVAGDILTVQADNGQCQTIMNGSVTINFNDPIVRTITTPDPLLVCTGDDAVITLDDSSIGDTYEILVNGVPSGFTAAGTGSALNITITTGNFADGDVLTVQADNGQCTILMNGSVTININDPAIFNVTTADPQIVCSVDDVTLDIDGSEVGVTYEILVNGAPSGFTAAGTGAALSITITAGSIADGDILTVEADNGQCTALMNGSVTINLDDPTVQNITTADPQIVCSIDDVTLDLDGSEIGVTYEILVNGAASGFTAAGTGAALSITITAGNFADGDVLTIQGTSGTASCTVLMNGSVTIDLNDPAIFNITTADPQTVCSIDDVTIDIDGSEAGVTYEILVNGAASGFTTAGTGAALGVTITAGNFADGDVLTVQADNGQCQTIMSGSVTININDPNIFNITTADPLVVCSVDDVTVVLDGSDAGVTYEVLVNGAASGFTAVGTGGALGVTITAGNFTDGDVLTIQANNGQCTAIMNGSVTINFNDPAIFNITTPDPQVVCSVDDVTIDLDGSEAGVTYEILVNGALSGFTTAGTGAGISITITAGNFTDGDVLTVQADNGQCVSFMNGSVTINFNDPAIFNITTADPQVVCSVDDVTIDLDGSEAGVTYEILVNGAASGFTTAGTGAALSVTITAGNFADGDVLTVQADNGQCQTIMNGSVTINLDDPAVQNITTADPLVICSTDDAIIDLDGSENGVTYEILVNGNPSGFTAAGTGAPLSITITAGDFADGDVLTVQATSATASCTVLMNGSVTIDFNDPAIFNITTTDPLVVCSTDDVTIDLDGSEVGVTYEILVNGAQSGFTNAGTGAAIGVAITAGSFADGDVLTVQADNGQCTILMNGSVTIDFNDPAVQNITTADPLAVCPGDDVIIDLDGSEVDVTYEILLNGAPSGITLAGTGAPLTFTIPDGSYNNFDVVTITGTSLINCVTTMNGSVTISINTLPAVQNITTTSPLNVCISDDVIISLGDSEGGVTYEILVNGNPSGFTATGTGSALDITLPAGNFADTDILTVESTNPAGCTALMNGGVLIDLNPAPAIQNITTATPAVLCSTDDLDVILDGSEGGITYELVINGVGTGTTQAGTGTPISFTLTAGTFVDGDVITITGDNGICVVPMNGFVVVDFEDPAVQNITTPDPAVVCSTDDLVIDLDGSQTGVNYEVFINGAASGVIVAGTDAAISFTLLNGTFADGDVITIQGVSAGLGCITMMNGSLTVNFATPPAVQNITTASPQTICFSEGLNIDLDGSEVGVTYEILINGAPSGITEAGTGAALTIAVPGSTFADGDVVTVRGFIGLGCLTNMNGSVTINVNTDPIIQNITTPAILSICNTDDAIIDLDGSEVGVNYEVLINGTPSGVIEAGTGGPLNFTVANGTFADGDVLTVQADNGTCTVLMNGSVTISAATAAPAPPVALDPIVIDCDNFDAIWNASAGATNYFIDVAEDAGFTIPVITNVAVGNDTTFNVSGLNIGTQYFYRVRAENACGLSADSNVISVTTINGIPAAPNAIAATDVECTSFTANWEAVAGGINYFIDVAEDAAFTIPVAGFTNLDVMGNTSVSVTGLTLGTDYFYRVRAANACGTSGDSNVIQVTTINGVPAAPVLTSLTAVCTNAVATWNAVAAATTYRIDVATDAGFVNIIPGFNNLDVGNVTTFNVTGLSNATTYFVRVRAENSCGVGADSNALSATTLPSTDPTCGGGGGGDDCFAFTVTQTSLIRPTCDDQDNGEITFEATSTAGGNLIFTLTDSAGFNQSQVAPSGSSFTFTNLSPADYTYIVEDQLGNICPLDFTIDLETIVEATADSFVDATCFDEPEGEATITIVSGGFPPYEFSLDGVNYQILPSDGIIRNLPPSPVPYNILIRDDASDVCPEAVQVTINNANPQIDATFSTTEASCDSNDGSITISNPTGGAGSPYMFSLDGGTPTSDLTFSNVTGGPHIVTITDNISCPRDFNVTVPFPGLVNFVAVGNDPDCSVNQANNGSIDVFFTDNGFFQVTLSLAGSTEPIETRGVNSNLTPSTTFDTLSRGNYTVTVELEGVSCPTTQSVSLSGGPFALNFDTEVICIDNRQAVQLSNITGEELAGDVFADIFRFRSDGGSGTSTFVTTVNLGQIFNGDQRVIDNEPFLDIPRQEYRVILRQQQSECPNEIESEPQGFFIRDFLNARVLETTQSLPDQPTGTMTVGVFSGGAPPYQIRIDLDSPAVAGQSFTTDFEEVTLNSNLDFETIYEGIPAGRYNVEVIDSVGCIISIIGRVELDTDIFIPTIFTPNGDDANETFFIRNLPPNGAQVIVTNRWGNVVFESNDYQNDWNAPDVSDGVYFYRLTVGDQTFTGWVEVLRGFSP
ncbi:MAG: gliding motility-associated C-terminal domain-containing protein [Bacteroidota bacterium]